MMIGFKVMLRIIFYIFVVVTASCKAEIVELTDATFEHQTQASTGMTTGSWFVLFKAEQCGLCKKVRPEFEQLSEDEDIPGYINFAVVDVPGNLRTSSRFDIHGFPVFLFFHRNTLYKFKGKRKFEVFKKWLLEEKETTIDGELIPEPVSEFDLFWKELQAAVLEFYTSTTGYHGIIGAGIAIMLIVFFGLILGLMSLLFFGPSTTKSSEESKKEK